MKTFLEESENQVIWSLHEKYCETTKHDKFSANLVDISVSNDGTWMQRGFRSHIGAGFVINYDTGFVIDYIVPSHNWITCQKQRKNCHLKPSHSGKSIIAWRTLIANLVSWRRNDPLGCWAAPNSMVWNTPPSLGMVTRCPSMLCVHSIMAVDHTMSQLRRRSALIMYLNGLGHSSANWRLVCENVTMKAVKTMKKSVLTGKKGLTDADM